MENTNLESLIQRAKTNTTTPMQGVGPVNKKGKVKNVSDEELQIAFYLPKKLYKKVKLHAFEKEVSIKSILNQSIENYINDIS